MRACRRRARPLLAAEDAASHRFVAELALALLLFSDAAGTDKILLEGSLTLPVRLLLIGHPTAEEAPGLASGQKAALTGYRQLPPEHTRKLFDRFERCHLAIKVVGVGTRCAPSLFTAAVAGPLFRQIKEARASVLEPYAGKSRHANHGERVVAGQRLMQAASDIFLGWTKGLGGHHYYIRQLRDVKLSAVIEGWSAKRLTAYGRLCAWALARAHARSGDAAAIAGYAGSGASFDDAICEFAVEYADQNKSDYRAFVEAVREHRIEAVTGL
jgi:hypothetical protein